MRQHGDKQGKTAEAKMRLERTRRGAAADSSATVSDTTFATARKCSGGFGGASWLGHCASETAAAPPPECDRDRHARSSPVRHLFLSSARLHSSDSVVHYREQRRQIFVLLWNLCIKFSSQVITDASVQVFSEGCMMCDVCVLWPRDGSMAGRPVSVVNTKSWIMQVGVEYGRVLGKCELVNVLLELVRCVETCSSEQWVGTATRVAAGLGVSPAVHNTTRQMHTIQLTLICRPLTTVLAN